MTCHDLERCIPAYVRTSLNANQTTNKAIRSNKLHGELRDRIISRAGEDYKISSDALNVPKRTTASVILKQKKFETTRTLLELVDQSN